MCGSRKNFVTLHDRNQQWCIFMKKHLLFYTLCLFCTVCGYAQDVFERTDRVTLFSDYHKAVITLNNGTYNMQPLSNIFLKNSTFVYKKGNDVLEANMQVIKEVRFGDRVFINMGTQLAEVLDSVGNNLLVLVRVINQEGLTHEYLNNSTITSLSALGDQLGVTRLDADPDLLRYPVDNYYYFIVKGKHILARDRESKNAIGRKKMSDYNKIVMAPGFKWTNRDCLMKILEVFSR